MAEQAARRVPRRNSVLTLAALSGSVVPAACGEPTVRHVGQPQAGPAGPAGPQGPQGEAGARGARGADGAAGKDAEAPVAAQLLVSSNSSPHVTVIDTDFSSVMKTADLLQLTRWAWNDDNNYFDGRYL